MPSDTPLTFGPFRLDPGTESVWRHREEIRLRPKTFAILRYLAECPRRLVTKEELLAAIWPDVAVGAAALAVVKSDGIEKVGSAVAEYDAMKACPPPVVQSATS